MSTLIFKAVQTFKKITTSGVLEQEAANVTTTTKNNCSGGIRKMTLPHYSQDCYTDFNLSFWQNTCGQIKSSIIWLRIVTFCDKRLDVSLRVFRDLLSSVRFHQTKAALSRSIRTPKRCHSLWWIHISWVVSKHASTAPPFHDIRRGSMSYKARH